ncbi:hypothetical protein GF415_03060 [Candidatus Micrarchaeota archaeon]|nr:hypothetical protein [Candidatus Micrarchaeota archaeon]
MAVSTSIKKGIGLTGRVFEESLDFVNDHLAKLFFYIIASLVVSIAGVGAGALVGAGLALFLEGYIGLVGAVVIAAIPALALSIAGLSYGIAPVFGGIEFVYSKKEQGYFEDENVQLAFRYVLFIVGIEIVLMGIIGGAIALGTAYPAFYAVGIGLAFLLYMLIFPASIVLSVVLYYYMPEMAIKKTGPVESIWGSYHLVKKNFWETVVFIIAVYVVMSIITGIGYLFFFILSYIGAFASIINPLFLAIAVGGLIVLAGFVLLIYAASLVLQIKFYKKVNERKA